MKGVRTVGGTQRFLSVFSGISSRFRTLRQRMTAGRHRAEMIIRFAVWDQITETTGLPEAA